MRAKFIDSKGNIFGRINIIDLFLVIFIIASFSLLALSYNKFNTRASGANDIISKSNITVRIEGVLIPEDVVKAIAVGDKDLRNTADYWAVVKDVEIVKPRTYLARSTGNIMKLESLDIDARRDIVVTLQIQAMKRAGEYVFGEQVMKLSKDFTFITSLYNISGRIIGMDVTTGSDKR
jgi:hypothetical protein